MIFVVIHLAFIFIPGFFAQIVNQDLVDRYEDYQDFEGLSKVIKNLVTVDNTDPVIISDFDKQKQVNIFFRKFHLFVSFFSVLFFSTFLPLDLHTTSLA